MTHSRGPGRPRILLVDNEPDQVEMYSYPLELAGFDVVAAYTGEAAIDRARDSEPHLIVLDVRLPDMSGWDVCAILKTDPRTDHVPIVILTAAAAPALAQQAADAGCVAHLLKPCYPDELTRAVREIVAVA